MKRTITSLASIFIASALIGQTNLKSDSISKIQLCLILDVSGSMSGLLGQAQNEIWKTIAFLEQFEKNDLETVIEMGIISYGGHNSTDGIEIISNFTSDIDVFAERLFLMKTGGGAEFFGTAVNRAVDSLNWSSETTFKSIIVAGNETVKQGERSFEEATKSAVEQGIILNTIYCGERENGIAEDWGTAAYFGKGEFTTINQDIKPDEFKTPYDNNLIDFYYDYKSTYFSDSTINQSLKEKQFDIKGEISPAFRDMIIYKFGRRKKVEEDLIDKFKNSNWELESFKKEEIPKGLRHLKIGKLKFKLLELSRKRTIYVEGFEAYAKKVEEFLEITIQPNLKDKTLDLAMKEIIGKQLLNFGFIKR